MFVCGNRRTYSGAYVSQESVYTLRTGIPKKYNLNLETTLIKDIQTLGIVGFKLTVHKVGTWQWQ